MAGCLHSLGQGGVLRARGVPSLVDDSIELLGSAMPNSAVLYFQGASVVNGGAGVVFGDGVKCTSGPFVRLRTKSNVTGASSYPGPNELPVSQKGLILSPGTRHYQLRYRNAAPFCTSDTFNYTNGLSLVWTP
jgi:hypothetical protein